MSNNTQNLSNNISTLNISKDEVNVLYLGMAYDIMAPLLLVPDLDNIYVLNVLDESYGGGWDYHKNFIRKLLLQGNDKGLIPQYAFFNEDDYKRYNKQYKQHGIEWTDVHTLKGPSKIVLDEDKESCDCLTGSKKFDQFCFTTSVWKLSFMYDGKIRNLIYYYNFNFSQYEWPSDINNISHYIWNGSYSFSDIIEEETPNFRKMTEQRAGPDAYVYALSWNHSGFPEHKRIYGIHDRFGSSVAIMKLDFSDPNWWKKKYNLKVDTENLYKYSGGYIKKTKTKSKTRRIRKHRTQRGGNEDLLYAVKANNLAEVNKSLSTPSVNVNITDKDGETPLHIATRKGQYDIVNALIADKRIDINIQNSDGYTALFIASDMGHYEIVNVLLTNSKTDVNIADMLGETPLHAAVRIRHYYIVNDLIADKRIDINKVNKWGETAFFYAFKYYDIDIINALLADPRTDINKADEEGDTPLFVAAHKGYIDIVRRLLADSRIQIDNKTLNYAINNKFIPSIKEAFYPLIQDKSRKTQAIIERKINLPSNIVGKVVPFFTGKKPKNYMNDSNMQNGGAVRRKQSRKMRKTHRHRS